MKILFIFICFSVYSFSQSEKDNPILLLHYTKEELNEIKENDSLKYLKLNYYYTESYIVKKIPCSDCANFDLSSFDVTKYEKYRLTDKRFTKTDNKFGFEVVLLSINELKYKIPIQLK